MPLNENHDHVDCWLGYGCRHRAVVRGFSAAFFIAVHARRQMIGAAALVCLTQVIYFEARGEPILGQYAVAEVVMNRVSSPRFPDTVCAVVAQDLGAGARDCQFSYMCDGVPEIMHETAARIQAERLAYIVGSGVTNVVKGATYFHSDSVSPDWSNVFNLTVTIDNHLFYKP